MTRSPFIPTPPLSHCRNLTAFVDSSSCKNGNEVIHPLKANLLRAHAMLRSDVWLSRTFSQWSVCFHNTPRYVLSPHTLVFGHLIFSNSLYSGGYFCLAFIAYSQEVDLLPLQLRVVPTAFIGRLIRHLPRLSVATTVSTAVLPCSDICMGW